MITAPMRAKEIAERLGDSPETFRRKRRRYQTQDGMPAPISEVGQPKWERSGMEAWLTRHHPLRPRLLPANDAALAPPPFSIEEHRAGLHDYYRQMATAQD